MALPSITLAELQSALQTLGKIDFTAAWKQVTSGDIQQELVVGEEAADVLAAFWPEAKYAEDAMKLLGFVIALKQAGVWHDAQPEDPAMARAAGPSHYTPGKPAVLAPGEDPYDPLGFDKRS